jgi:hypothetical protein
MKILFLLGASSRVRNFDHTIRALADRGNDVRLAGRLRKGAFELPDTVQHDRISGRVNPTERIDEWRDYVDLVRGARDYVRYFDPRYAHATRLVRRAYEIAPTPFVLFCERHPWIKRHWRLASRVLALCERLIPVDPGFEAFLREEAPDLVLVTPLVTFESYQTDYLKAADRLGIPVVFIPFSWDNLTNKGLMRIHPDRVLVWNETQKSEAIELHGSTPDRVVVTGAARFDDFFARTPSTTRAELCAQYGLDPTRPIVLYLGSSQLTGPNEMELVRRWAESIRFADDDVVRTCGILIRPHPALRGSWESVDLSDLGHVGVSLNASRTADQELFDSIYHAHAAVGLNTSAMLEAAIVGRPVYTLMIPGFDQGQVGTIHFSYLVEAHGGLATVARDFAEHHRQLAGVLGGDAPSSPRSRRFAEGFLRPHGIDRAVSPILTDEIERAGSIAKRPQPAAPFWHLPLRRALHRWVRRRTAVAQKVEDSTVVGTSISLRPVKTSLEEMQHETGPIFVGPWLDSITNELLYWIPFVRWASATYGLSPERLVAISRPGADDWYRSLAQRCLDPATLFSCAELEQWTRRGVPQSEQNPKQAVMAPFDQEIVERAARSFDLSDYQVLHPSFFFRVRQRLHKDRTMNRLGEVLHYAPLTTIAPRHVAHPPKASVAMSVAFTDALPDIPKNRRLLAELVHRIAADHDVVLVDDASWCPELRARPRVHPLDVRGDDGGRVDVLTDALAGAMTFVGPYGDSAVLAASCGTPAIAYHSEPLPRGHFEAVAAASSTAGWGPLTVERARKFRGIRLPESVHA